MPAFVPLQSEFDVLVNSLTTRIAKLETSDVDELARIATLEQDDVLAKARLDKLEAPIIPPVPYDPQVFWSAGMEGGTLNEWPSRNNNTGPALSSAVLALPENIPAHGGLWAMKQVVTGLGGATRMGTDILSQVKTSTEFWVTWYDYYPAPVHFPISDMWQFWGINGFDGVNYNPVWGLFVDGTTFTPILGWSPNSKAPSEGPHTGEAGKRFYTSTTPISVGAWNKFELRIKPAADFTGIVQVYMNGKLLFDLTNVKTRYVGSGDPGFAGFMYIEHYAYGSVGTHYVDDVTYSLKRMP